MELKDVYAICDYIAKHESYMNCKPTAIGIKPKYRNLMIASMQALCNNTDLEIELPADGICGEWKIAGVPVMFLPSN